MGRHGENIRKRKDGRWEARYIQSYNTEGKAVYRYVYGKSYLEVKEKRRIDQTEKQIPIKNVNADRLRTTFGQLSQEWLSSRKSMVKESTYASYVHTIQKHLLPELEHVYITSINVSMLDKFLKGKLKTGRLDGDGGLSLKTVSDIRSVLKMILSYGQEQGFENLSGITLPLPGNHIPKVDVLTSREQRKLESELFREITPMHLGIMISLYAGLRIGEVCALQWKDINLEAGTVSVNKTVIRIQNTDRNAKAKTKVLVESPKTACSERIIPLPDDILPYYINCQCEENAYILTGTGHMMEPRVCLQKYKKVLRSAGINSYSFHTLRHTFATRCVEKDFDIKSLSEIMGHSSVTITMQRYVHPSFERKKEQMNRLTIGVVQGQNCGQEQRNSL